MKNKSTDYSMATLLASQQRRQAVLDFLNGKPGGASFEAILLALQEYSFESMRGTIANLINKGEVAVSGPPRSRWYHPLTRTTHSAESVRQGKLARNNRNRKPASGSSKPRRPKPPAPEKPAPEWNGGSIVYREGDNPAIRKNQRGQGAVRPCVTVNCFTLF